MRAADRDAKQRVINSCFVARRGPRRETKRRDRNIIRKVRSTPHLPGSRKGKGNVSGKPFKVKWGACAKLDKRPGARFIMRVIEGHRVLAERPVLKK